MVDHCALSKQKQIRGELPSLHVTTIAGHGLARTCDAAPVNLACSGYTNWLVGATDKALGMALVREGITCFAL